MKEYSYKKLDLKEDALNFNKEFFVSSRYSMTAMMDCENLYSFSKENGFSFFNLCVAAVYKTIDSIPELRQVFIDGESREYEHLNIILTIPKEDHDIQEVCIESIHNFKSCKEWNDFLNNVKDNPKDHQYIFTPQSINHVFALLSCFPWYQYVSFTDATLDSGKFCPAAYWGKYENGKLPVTITVNHIFVYGHHTGIFFNRLAEYMKNPHSIFPE